VDRRAVLDAVVKRKIPSTGQKSAYKIMFGKTRRKEATWKI